MPKNFRDLCEREILALAISLEEEDIRTYSDIAEACARTIREPHTFSPLRQKRKTATATVCSSCTTRKSATTFLDPASGC